MAQAALNGPQVELLASSALTTDPSGAVSSIVSVYGGTQVTLWIKANVGAAGAYAHLVLNVSGLAAAPAQADDSWYQPTIADITPTDTLLTGSVPTGADYTIAPEWGIVKLRPIVMRTIDGDANTDQIRMAQTITLPRGARWMYLFAEEAVGNMVVAVDWQLHA
jgi:hypothetical protein